MRGVSLRKRYRFFSGCFSEYAGLLSFFKKKENTATFYPDPDDVRDPVFNPLIKHFTTPKDFTATPPKEETKNPMGPIRGLLSRSRQDLSKIDADVAFKKPLESASSSGSDRGRANSDYYPPYKIDLSSPLHQTNNLYRVHSSESVVKPAEEIALSNTPEDDTDIVPFNRHPNNRSERPEKLERPKSNTLCLFERCSPFSRFV